MVKTDTAEAVTPQPLMGTICTRVQVLSPRVLENALGKSPFWTIISSRIDEEGPKKKIVKGVNLMFKRLMTFDMMCSILNAQITVNS